MVRAIIPPSYVIQKDTLTCVPHTTLICHQSYRQEGKGDAQSAEQKCYRCAWVYNDDLLLGVYFGQAKLRL